MTDLTLLYYTANQIDYAFMHRVRAELPANVIGDQDDGAEAFERLPRIVTVTQQPDQWGCNICVGEIGPSIYNCYQQILIGARAATTPFVACVEDDSLYVPEHFTYRPRADVFAYNVNRWVITRRLSDDRRSRTAFFYWRRRTQMAQCIAPRALLIETLEERFAKFPDPVPDPLAKAAGWGEPGRYERLLGLPPRRFEHFETAQPNVTFNHARGLMGRRQTQPTDTVCDDLPPWGEANPLWDRIHG